MVLFIGDSLPAWSGMAYHPATDKVVEMSSTTLTKDAGFSVLIFYPVDFTFVCPTEIWEFSDAYEELTSRNAEVIFVSYDSAHSHYRWAHVPRSRGGLQDGVRWPMIGDVNRKLIRTCGLESPSGEFYRGILIFQNHKLVHYSVNDTPVGRSVDEVLRLIDAFAVVAENDGVVCPVGGSAT